VRLEIIKKIVEEENGGQIDGETPEQLRGPTKKVTNRRPSVQAEPEGENGDGLLSQNIRRAWRNDVFREIAAEPRS
jgi:hypothetical protein